MAKIKNASTLVKILYLSNLSARDGLAMTPMLNGSHGIGKTQIVKQTAEDLGGYSFTLDGSILKEGDAAGIPFPRKCEDGLSEVGFVKHYIFNDIFRLQEFYYKKACDEGFLNGRVRLKVTENGDEFLINGKEETLVADRLMRIKRGQDNIYSFGEELDGKTKLELIESGEIKPVLLFIDELNRAEQQTMKELMNIILNKNVNGYDLPWWVSIVAAVNPSSQNSSYATVELDPAQYSRFCNIKVTADLGDWVDYALEKKLNSDVVEAVGLSEKIFVHKDSGTEDQTEMTPDPRAWEMVAHIYDTIDDVCNTHFFTASERKDAEKNLYTLVKSKVGENAARVLSEAIRNKENHIKPEEIMNGKAPNISPEVKKKFSNLHRISQKIISDALANYLLQNCDKFSKLKKGLTQADKVEFGNYKMQMKEFMPLLDVSTQQLFLGKIIENKACGSKIYLMFSSSFDKEMLQNLEDGRKGIEAFTRDNGSND